MGEFRDEDNGSLLVAAPCLDGMPHADLQLQQEVVEEDLKRDGGLFVGDLCILADGKVAHKETGLAHILSNLVEMAPSLQAAFAVLQAAMYFMAHHYRKKEHQNLTRDCERNA